jgi:hypothetical protein
MSARTLDNSKNDYFDFYSVNIFFAVEQPKNTMLYVANT